MNRPCSFSSQGRRGCLSAAEAKRSQDCPSPAQALRTHCSTSPPLPENRLMMPFTSLLRCRACTGLETETGPCLIEKGKGRALCLEAARPAHFWHSRTMRPHPPGWGQLLQGGTEPSLLTLAWGFGERLQGTLADAQRAGP